MSNLIPYASLAKILGETSFKRDTASKKITPFSEIELPMM